MKTAIELLYFFSLLGTIGGTIFFFVPLYFGVMALKENVWDNFRREGIDFKNWQCIWVGPGETVLWSIFPLCTIIFWTMTICGFQFVP